mmetsp:Transcript_49657/g.116751  ORF Transcript_49657/g.116751 Transcript_49657/m.116751 type:complete len:96 (-) Transcript_49657:16-303(-)
MQKVALTAMAIAVDSTTLPLDSESLLQGQDGKLDLSRTVPWSQLLLPTGNRQLTNTERIFPKARLGPQRLVCCSAGLPQPILHLAYLASLRREPR